MKSEKSSDILIKGARTHNLKNISVNIKRNSFTVFTGLSGSGKSSLAFDTIFAEGQRRYVESLSSYARQFLGKIEKPAVDSITGISPAIAIEQKVNTRNPRSTVGTSTEIYEYLKLLYARIGVTYSIESNVVVKRHNHEDVIQFLLGIKESERFLILAPALTGDNVGAWLKSLIVKGFSRVFYKNEILNIDDVKQMTSIDVKSLFLLIDRFKGNDFNEEDLSALTDSIQTAFYEGQGKCVVYLNDSAKFKSFNKDFEHDGITYPEPSLYLFSFNNPLGACKECEGFGSVIGIDPDLVIPNKTMSVYDGAVACWKGDKMSEWQEDFIMNASSVNFPIHSPYSSLNENDKEILWKGNGRLRGINEFFRFLEQNAYKIQYRVMISRYRGKTVCPVCKGSRLRPETNQIRIGGKSINELVTMQVKELYEFIINLKLSQREEDISKRLLIELKSRISYLLDVGLEYLSLNRASNSLSGGESQRIQLSTSLGSSLVGSMYILDEPSIGLHPRDTERLISVLKKLNNLGNTLIVVEHDEDIIVVADDIVDLGPEAGLNGGQIVFQGNAKELLQAETLTSDYLTGKKVIPIPASRRKWRNSISISKAYANNLQNINVKIPLQILTCVSGVSGSGKSTLIKEILYKSVFQKINNNTWPSGQFEKIEGDFDRISQIELIDQNPIGKSSRSNPVTYIKAYDEIRALYSTLPEAVHRGLKPSDFSFNVDGGRCDTCKGEGEITVEMQFMADIRLTCDECGGKRFKDELLELNFSGKNISEILDFTIDEAIAFFEVASIMKGRCAKICEKLSPLREVGLGYVKLGQSSSTLSGGEAQRVKLAYFLSKKSESDSILFLFDEPSTGLHFHDINKLLISLNALVNRGHSVVVIEHHPDIIKSADWIIDLGPEGGDKGGRIVFEGIPEELIKNKESYTGKYLAQKFK